MEKCADCGTCEANEDQLCDECYAKWENEGVLEQA